MKRIMQILLSIIVVIIILFGLLYAFQHKLIFFPQKLSQNHTFTFSQQFEERFFKTEEDIRIHALHFKVQEPKGLIYYLHGNAGSLDGWGQVAQDFTQYQYDVIIIDFRGYGKSNGKQTEKGMLKDAQVIYEKLLEEYQESRIIVYGRSIGSGMATFVAAQNSPGMLILESPFYNLPDVAKQHFPWFPRSLIRFRFRNDRYLEKISCPVIIFHGTEDEVINVQASHKLKEKFKPADQLILVEGGHHNDLIMYGKYRDNLKIILEKNSRN